jgi:hypothetical protein
MLLLSFFPFSAFRNIVFSDNTNLPISEAIPNNSNVCYMATNAIPKSQIRLEALG